MPKRVLDLHIPNPSFIDTSRVVRLCIDTGPPPDALLFARDRDAYRRLKKERRRRRKHHH